jgi:hypothetical protein
LSSFSDDSTTKGNFPGLQRLISAALANRIFAEALLADPMRALEQLPIGVELTHEEQVLVTQVHGATNLANFAAYLCVLIQDTCLERKENSADTAFEPLYP